MTLPFVLAALLFFAAGLIALNQRRYVGIGLMLAWPAFLLAVVVALEMVGGVYLTASSVAAIKVGFMWSCVVSHCVALALGLFLKPGPQ